jgi:hypothetical protein
MHNYMLSIWTLECANGLHKCAAVTVAVTATFGIYMAREKAERTVVAMMAAAWQSSNELPAVAALEAVLRAVPLPAIILSLLASSHWFHLLFSTSAIHLLYIHRPISA